MGEFTKNFKIKLPHTAQKVKYIEATPHIFILKVCYNNFIMATRTQFEVGEWYHCFNRGIEKRTTFEDPRDYERFLSLLYLANDTVPITLFNEKNLSLTDALMSRRKETIVTVGAYCLMPNHYHLVLREESERGISTFMQKIGTAYAMYFNTKNKRTGNLFMKPFRSKHISDDRYFQQVVEYVHFNPAELFEPEWKQGEIRDSASLKKNLLTYPYGSLKDFTDKSLITREILGQEVFNVYRTVPLPHMMRDALGYYQEHAEKQDSKLHPHKIKL